MKKITIVAIPVALVLLGIVFLGGKINGETESSMPVITEEDSYAFGKAWGEYLKNENSNSLASAHETDELYAEGNTVNITQKQMDQSIKYYELIGYSESDAEEKAFKIVSEASVLRKKAETEGYTATIDEVQAYTNMIREMYDNSEDDNVSKLQTKGIIEGYGDEEAYWKYIESVYITQLPSEKYVNDLQKEFYSDGTKSQEDWSKYFEDFKQQLVKEQEFKIAH